MNTPEGPAFPPGGDTAGPERRITLMDDYGRDDAIMRLRRRAHTWLDVAAGSAVLDAGCGSGDVAVDLIAGVSPGGLVAALDSDSNMLGEAARRAARAGVSVHLVQGDVTRLGFPDQTFDACRAERILQHVVEPARAVAEMARVLRPGGRLVVIDSDWRTRTWNHPDQQTTSAIVRFIRERRIPSADVGARLPALLLDAGLDDVRIRGEVLVQTSPTGEQRALFPRLVGAAIDEGRIPRRDGVAWLEELTRLERSGRYLATLCLYVVAGRRP